jgi:hypothetical protein
MQYFARPLDQGLSVERAHLERTLEGWGRLRIAIIGADSFALGEVQTVVDTHFLRLVDAEGREHRYGIRDLRRDEIWVDDIPFGQYAATVESSYGATRLPSEGPVSLSIGNAPSTLHVDLSGLGAIVEQVRRKDGSTCEESAAIGIGRDRGGCQHAARFPSLALPHPVAAAGELQRPIEPPIRCRATAGVGQRTPRRDHDGRDRREVGLSSVSGAANA